MSEIEALAPGQQLGRYELLAQVARGGMGQVWVARLKGARGFQKLVAIKTLLPELLDDERVEQMLLEEARIASLIHHPNVVQTTELGEHRGYLYLVMEWVDGESLAFIQRRAEERGAMPLAIAVNFVAQACRGLHAAHELTNDLGVHLGVVHRDVSPHNVLVTHAGVVKLVDFGIAKATNQGSSSTVNGEVKGKFAFMAPEQVLAENVDRRADIFALGITLYQLTTGVHPFRGQGGRANVLHAITSDTPATPPSEHAPGYPRALEVVVMRTLEKDPARRFQDAAELCVALEEALPEAFAPTVDAERREFLLRVMGDRAAARREALRRFQLAADERALSSLDASAVPALPSQSAGSLRAVIVQGADGPVDLELAHPRNSRSPTVIARPRRVRRVFAAALMAAAACALGFAGARLLKQSPQAELRPVPAYDSPVPAALPVVSAEVAAPRPAPPAHDPPSGLDAGSPAVESSSRQPPPVSSVRAPKKAKKRASSLGLMAPDYAQ